MSNPLDRGFVTSPEYQPKLGDTIEVIINGVASMVITETWRVVGLRVLAEGKVRVDCELVI